MVPGYKVALSTTTEGTAMRFLTWGEALIVATVVIVAIVAVVLWRSR